MTYPYITAVTAGLLLVLQIALALAVSGSGGRTDNRVGLGGVARMPA